MRASCQKTQESHHDALLRSRPKLLFLVLLPRWFTAHWNYAYYLPPFPLEVLYYSLQFPIYSTGSHFFALKSLYTYFPRTNIFSRCSFTLAGPNIFLHSLVLIPRCFASHAHPRFPCIKVSHFPQKFPISSSALIAVATTSHISLVNTGGAYSIPSFPFIVSHTSKFSFPGPSCTAQR